MKRIITMVILCGLANFVFSQNFGIDESSPNQKLIIGANGGIGFSGSGLNSSDKKLYSPADGDLEWVTHSGAAVHGFAISHQGTKAVYLNIAGNSYLNGGNVGIGTTGPAYKLDVNGTTRISGGLAVSGTAPSASLYGGIGRINSNFDNILGGGILVSDDGGFFDYNDGYVTFNGSTGLKIAGNSGAGSTGFLLVQGDARFGCRSGFWAVADGRICMESAMRGPNTIHNAIGECRGVAPGCRICEHNDFQQACGAGFAPYGGVAPGWYGEHGVGASGNNWDDEFGTWNGGACANNNDGPAFDANQGQSYRFKCCY